MAVKNLYLKNFLITCAGGVGYSVVLLSFGLDLFHSIMDFILGLGILFAFLTFMVIMKRLNVNTEELLDGIWAGIVLYCWTPIVTLSWNSNFWDALAGASSFFVVGLVVLVIGYYVRRKLR